MYVAQASKAKAAEAKGKLADAGKREARLQRQLDEV